MKIHFLLALTVILFSAYTTYGEQKPNIVFVLADQLGYKYCGYAGDKYAKTPNIDKLATQSMNFEQAVVSMPVCSAFRASLFTGKYATSTGNHS